MAFKRPSVLFPDRQTSIDYISYSKNEVSKLCNLKPFTSLTGSICNYIVQKNKTKQMKMQYDYMKSAVNAQYTELENQAYIHFQELTEQLHIEFEAKSKLLAIEVQKAEAEADRLFLEHQIAFEKYFKTSEVCKGIFNILTESAGKIAELIELAEKNDIATNTRYYIKLCENYRVLTRGIEKYTRLLV